MDNRGFSLIESVLAIGLLATALITLAHLMAIAVESGALARDVTFTTMMGAQKMEELRTERVLAEADEAEPLDASGNVVCGGAATCAAMVYVRRWSIVPLASVPETMVIRITVSHAHRRQREARLESIRGRVRE